MFPSLPSTNGHVIHKDQIFVDEIDHKCVKNRLRFLSNNRAKNFKEFCYIRLLKIRIILKIVSAIFYQIFISHQMIALQKLWKMFFISSKKLFSFSKISVKFYDVINCLNKNLITHFAWYLEKQKRYDIETLPIGRVLNKEHCYWKTIQKMCTRG